MITGYNTDIKFNGVTYHVQTEDKGLKTPLILSLVYQGGTILASKRTPYDDLLGGELDERILEKRLSRQHMLICAAIRAGRIEDLRRMTLREAAPKETNGTPEPVTAGETQGGPARPPGRDLPEGDLFEIPPNGNEPPPARPSGDSFETRIPKPSDGPFWDLPVIEDVTVVEDQAQPPEILEDQIILPPEAIEIVGDLERFQALLDDELKVKILGDNTFRSGDRRNVNILVCRGPDERAVDDANIMVKVIGSAFRPLIFHSKADSNGVATVFLKLPSFRSGRAAVLVRAMNGGEETELRRAISPE